MINLDDLRAVVRPYVAQKIGLPELLQQMWPLLRRADGDSAELAASIEDVLALHASRSIDDIALRQHIGAIAFAPGSIADVTVSDVRSLSGIPPQGGVMSIWSATRTRVDLDQLIPA